MTRGRRRQVDTSTHFCPNPNCQYRGWTGWGNIRANGHPGGGRWRQLLCIVCRGYFLETLGTIFHGKRSSPDLIVRVISCLAEGLGIRGTARVFEVDPNTVLQWLVETADQLRVFSHYFLHDLQLRQVQLDELYAVLSALKAGTIGEDEAIECLSRSPHWVWVAMEPESKLLEGVSKVLICYPRYEDERQRNANTRECSHGSSSTSLLLLSRYGYCAPWHDAARQATVSLSAVPRRARAHISPRI
jgi:hypothetical protein